MKPINGVALITSSGRVLFDSNAKSGADLMPLVPDEAHVEIVRVRVSDEKRRSPTASALLHIWFAQLEEFMGEDRAAIKQILKIKFEFPIIKKSPAWPKLKNILTKMGWREMSYPQKLELAEWIPVTSIMTTSELKEMMDAIKNWAMNQFNIELNREVE